MFVCERVYVCACMCLHIYDITHLYVCTCMCLHMCVVGGTFAMWPSTQNKA